jgi:hypothetical protein
MGQMATMLLVHANVRKLKNVVPNKHVFRRQK